MIETRNVPGLLNAAYYGFNRALPNPDGSRGDFQPVKDSKGNVLTTYCNQFIQYICSALGYIDFKGMNANQMIDFMEKDGSGWIKSADHRFAQDSANAGVLVIAGRKAAGHGHVCLIVPGVLEKSGNWCASVPKCVNVGGDVFFGKKISFAFRSEDKCDYFALAKML
jgi:hypothetical protein